MNILEFIKRFPDEGACRLKFKEQRDQIGVICRKCNCKDHFWLENKQCYECKSCPVLVSVLEILFDTSKFAGPTFNIVWVGFINEVVFKYAFSLSIAPCSP